MKKPLYTLLIALLFLNQECLSQTDIPYGSNDGKYQMVNGINLYYEEYGQGTPLLLIHGGLSSIADMSPVIPALSRHYRVIAVDCPGQGRSEQAPALSYQLMADYFSEMIDLLKLDSVYLFGYSDGGNVALLMAADHPDKVKKVAVFAAASHTSGYYEEITAGLGYLTPEVFEKDYRWWLDPHLERTPQPDQWQKFVTDFAKMCATPEIVPVDKLTKIRSQVLLVQGDNDIVKPEHAVELHRAIRGSQLCIVSAASHFILYERPELLNLIVSEFFLKDAKLFHWSQLE